MYILQQSKYLAKMYITVVSLECNNFRIGELTAFLDELLVHLISLFFLLTYMLDSVHGKP